MLRCLVVWLDKNSHNLKNLMNYIKIVIRQKEGNLRNAFLPPQKKAKKGISQKGHFFSKPYLYTIIYIYIILLLLLTTFFSSVCNTKCYLTPHNRVRLAN